MPRRTLSALRSAFLRSADASAPAHVDALPAGETDVPLLIVGGFTETGETFLPLHEHFCGAGRRSLSLCVKPQPIEDLAKAHLDLLDAKGIARCDAVAHSMGAIVAVEMAKRRPGVFRNLLLYAPAGLYPREHLARLIFGGIRSQITHIAVCRSARRDAWMKAYAGHVWRVTLRSAFGSPLQTLRQLWALRSADIAEDVRALQRDTRIGVLLPSHDTLFPLQPEDISRRAGIPRERIRSMPGTHLAHAVDADALARAAEGLLAA